MHDERDGCLALILREPPQGGREFLIIEVGCVSDRHAN